MNKSCPRIAWQSYSLAGPRPFHLPWTVRGAACHPAQMAGDVRSAAVDSPALDNDTEEAKLARLWAVLFLAKEPLHSRKLSQYSRLADGTEARTLVSRLNRQLDASGRSFRIEPVAGGYQMVTRPRFAKWLRRLEYVPGEVRLSAPAMETLAVIAYRQPVMRADIEAVRGVSCGEILSQLLSRDLVRIGGRSNELGRPYLYNTTRRFLQLFGLRSLDTLPHTEIIQAVANNSVKNQTETNDDNDSPDNGTLETTDRE